MSGDIQFGLKVSYDGKSVASGATATTEQIKAIGTTAEASGAKASRALDYTAMSAKQTAFALRGVPAQFTDIVTAIASGQAPLTVMIQQGGQLKDMFGGVGPAARALGGYIAGLVNPYTVAAAAAAGLAFAHHQGRAESDAYTRALLLSGNAAGKTVAQMDEAARRVARSTGSTQGGAAGALTAAIGAGIPGRAFDLVAESALRMERIAGKAIDDTVAEFAKLGRDPVAASVKLNEQLNYLTEGTYRQIRAFAEQGRGSEASALAIRAYADAIAERTGDVFENLSKWEKGWLGVKAAGADVLDWVANIGRGTDRLEAAAETVMQLRRAIQMREGRRTAPGEMERLRAELATAEVAMVVERNKVRIATDAAKAKEEENKKRQAGLDLVQKEYALLTAEQKLKAELKLIDVKGAEAGWDQEKINKLKAATSRDFNKSMLDARLGAETSTLKAWHEEYRDTVKQALDESRVDYQGYWALIEAGERHLTEEQLRMAKLRSGDAAKRGDTPEVVKLKGEIDTLQARLKTGIGAETERGLAGDREKAREAGRNAQLDATNADIKALATAAAWRRENLSLIDQELLAAREKSASDLRDRQAQLTKNDALKHAPELLEQYRQVAASQSAETLAAIESEIRARREANNEWINGAKAATRDYVRTTEDAAGQTKRAWAGTWRRAEDDLTQFFMTGKLNVRGFVQYTLSELARIKLAQPLVKSLASASDGLFDKLFGGGGSSFPTPPAGVTEISYGGFAKGAAFNSPDLHRYINTVVDTPTRFRFAKGGAIGEMGEAGPEGIMPLKRDKQGRLGVIAESGAGGGDINLNYTFEIDARGAAAGVGPILENVIEAAVQRSRSVFAAELNSGGPLAYATGRRR